MTVRVWLAAAVLAAGADGVSGQPRFNPPAGPSQWQLGVATRDLPTGVQVVRVLPGSAGQQAGLEPGDIITHVNNRRVGYVGGRLFDLEDVLNQQADPYGRVSLRLIDRRTGQLRIAPVALTPVGWPQPPGPWPPGPQPPWPQPPGPQPPWPPGGNARAQIDQWFRQYLKRPLTELGYQMWLVELNKGMPLPEVQVGIVASAEYYDRHRNRPDQFIRGVYRDAAGRVPNPAEVNQWVDRLVRVHRGNRLAFTPELLRALGVY